MPRLLKRLRKYQLDALRWSEGREHLGFFIDMRGGKTKLVIRRIKKWGCTGDKLIVCPESAIQSWIDELINEGEHPPIELTGTAKERKIKLYYKVSNFFTKWFIINKEGHRALPEIKDINWDVIIFDESRYIANPKSQMSKFYVNNFRNVKHRIILTGTPDYNEKLDFYQQLRFLDYKSLPYKDYWHFRTKAFFQSGYDYVIKKKDAEILKNALNKYCYFLSRKDIPGGRTVEYIKRIIKMPRKLKKEYDVVENEFVLEKHDMKTIFATEAHMWMMRMCGGMRRTRNDGFIMEWHGKIDAVKELLDGDLKDDSAVIFCRFKAEVYSLYTLLSAHKIKCDIYTGDQNKDLRRKIIAHFNSNKKPNVLIAHPAAISHGTDLSAATCIIFYSQPPGGELRDQSEKRIMTYADEKHMLIIDLLVKDSVDEDTRMGHLEGDSRRKIFERAVKRCRKHCIT
jgi:superfamily II DNA or RNA helicase